MATRPLWPMPPGGLLQRPLTPEEEMLERLRLSRLGQTELPPEEEYYPEEAAPPVATGAVAGVMEEMRAEQAPRERREPDPNKRYSLGDAIEELGLSPMEAVAFVKEHNAAADARGKEAPATEEEDLPLVLDEPEPEKEKPEAKKPLVIVEPLVEETPLVASKPDDPPPPLVGPNVLGQAERARQVREAQEGRAAEQPNVEVDPKTAAYVQRVTDVINSKDMWGASGEELFDAARRVATEEFDNPALFDAHDWNFDAIKTYRIAGGERPSPAGFQGEETERSADERPRFEQSVVKGAATTKQLLWAGLEAVGEVTGAEGLAEAGRRGRVEAGALAQVMPEGVKLDEIRSLADATQWARQVAGEQLPLMAAPITGAVLGKVVAGSLGAKVGAFGPAWTLATGEVQSGNKEINEDQKAGLATLTGGTAVAVLDTIMPVKLGKMLGRAIGADNADEVAKRILLMPVDDSTAATIRRLVQETGRGFRTESLTEAAQTPIAELATAIETGTPIQPGMLMRIVEAATTGALMGGGMGIATGAAQEAGTRAIDNAPIRELEAAQPAPGAINEAAVRAMSPTRGDIAGVPAGMFDELGRTRLPPARPVRIPEQEREAEPRRVAPTPTPVDREGREQRFALPEGKVTSRMGPRRSFRTANGQMASSNHAGVDIVLPGGTKAKVTAGADGVVAFADEKGGYGNHVVIKHSDGTFSSYSHLSSISVKKGDEVAQGAVVGRQGKTGNATGVHLHLERRDARGRPIDPQRGSIVQTQSDPDTGENFDTTDFEVDNEPFDVGEDDDAFFTEEYDDAFTEETGQSIEVEEEVAPAPEEAEATTEVTSRDDPAVPEVIRNSPVPDPEVTAERVAANLDEAPQRNAARIELERLATEPAADVDWTQPQPGEQPVFAQDESGTPTEEVVGFVAENGAMRPVGEPAEATTPEAVEATPISGGLGSEAASIPEATLPDETVNQRNAMAARETAALEAVAGPQYQPAPTFAGVDLPTREAIFERLPVPREAAQLDTKRGRGVGQAVALGLAERPADFDTQSKTYRTAFNVGFKEGQAALAAATPDDFVATTSGAEVVATTPVATESSAEVPTGTTVPDISIPQLWARVDVGAVTPADVERAGVPRWAAEQAVAARTAGQITNEQEFRDFLEERDALPVEAGLEPATAPAPATAPDPAVVARADKIQDRLYDIRTNDDKGAAKRYAQKLAKDGVISQADLQSLATMFKDPDMGADDITGELSGMVDEWVRGQTPTAPSVRRRVARQPKSLADIIPGWSKVAKWLSKDERALARGRAFEGLTAIYDSLPSAAEIAAIAQAGRAARGWYRDSALTLLQVFGRADAVRFVALLSGTSPQISVHQNLDYALRIWTGWIRAGRPTDRKAIYNIINADAPGTMIQTVGPNTVRALTENTDTLMLSGPKVNSFFQNLMGNLQEVTNDTWIARFMGRELTGKVKRDGRGVKTPVYMAFNARMRQAAKVASERTGHKWEPAEIQETVWAWTKAVYEMRDAAGENRTIEQMLDAGDVTHADIADRSENFSTLMAQGVFRNLLQEAGYGEQAGVLGNARPVPAGAGARGSVTAAEGTGFAQPAFERHLRRAGRRLEQSRPDERGGGRVDEQAPQAAAPAAKPITDRHPEALVRERLDWAGRGGIRTYERTSSEADRSLRRLAATYTPTDTYASVAKKAGYPAVTMTELQPTTANASRFRDAIQASKEATPYGAAVYVYTPGEYLKMRLFLSEDGQSGFAVKDDGDIVSVFSDGGGKVHSMLALAVQEGGTKLDAFDTVLPKLYAISGFKEVDRVSWDDQYKPDGWDKDTFALYNKGEPDVVFMEYDENYSPFAEVQPEEAARPPETPVSERQGAEPTPTPEPAAPAPEGAVRRQVAGPAPAPTLEPSEQRKRYILDQQGRLNELVSPEVTAVAMAQLREQGLEGVIPLEVVEGFADDTAKQWTQGEYDPNPVPGGLIRIAKLATNIRATVRHETVHWARDNLWSKNEWLALATWAKNDPTLMAWAESRYPDESRDIQIEEAVAEGFARWRGGAKLSTPGDLSIVERALAKLRDLILAVRRALGAAGMTEGEINEAIAILGRLERVEARQEGRATFGKKGREGELSFALLTGRITPQEHHNLRLIPEPTRKQAAWHGSQATGIERFLLEFIGTGEGAQAFGWGLYFAEKRGVAEYYRIKNSLLATVGAKEPVDVLVEVDGQPIRDWVETIPGPPRALAAYEVADRVFNYLIEGNKPYNGWLDQLEVQFHKDVDGHIHDLEDLIATEDTLTGEQAARSEIRALEEERIRVEQVFRAMAMRKVGMQDLSKGGQMYSVEVPENEDLLDLDATLDKQSSKVKRVLEKVAADIAEASPRSETQVIEGDTGFRAAGPFWSWTGETLQNILKSAAMMETLPVTSDAMETAMTNGHVAMATSIYFRDRGIVGSRYLDRDSRGVGEGTRNFVIFDDNHIALHVSTEDRRVPDRPTRRSVVRPQGFNGPLGDTSKPDPSIWRRIHDQTMSLLTAIGSAGREDFENTDNIIDAFKRKVTNRYQQIIKVQEQVRQLLGVDRLAPDMNPMEMVTADERGYQNQYLIDNMLRPMMRELGRRGLTIEELGLFLYARHAAARNARVARINPEFRDPANPGSGMTDTEAAQHMADFQNDGKLSDLQDVARYIDAMVNYAQQVRLNSGLITQDDIAAGFQPGEFYVPLRGNQELEPEHEADWMSSHGRQGSGFSVKGKESQRMMGRHSQADLAEIVGYTITQAQQAIDRGYRNRVGQSIAQMLRQVAADQRSDFVQIDRVKRVPVWNKAKGQVEYQMQTRVNKEEDERTIFVKENGHVTKLTFNNRNPSAMRFVKAAKNLGIKDLPTWIRIFSFFTRPWTLLRTGLNPEFVVSNAIKDMQTGVVNMSSLDIPGMRRAMTKNLLSLRPLRAAWTGAWSERGAGEGSGNPWFEAYHEYEANGGKLNYNQFGPVEDAIREARVAMRQAQRSNINPAKWGRATLDAIGNANSAIENMTRLAAYKALRDQGVEPKQAAEAVRELTTNFAQHGEWGPAVNAAYGFANASTIGSARFIGTLMKKPSVFAGLLAIGILQDALNQFLDDEEWEKYDEEERRNNFILLLPEWLGFDIRLPIGYGLNAITTIGRKGSELARGAVDKEGKKLSYADAASDIAFAFINAFSPVTGSTWWHIATPSIFDAFVDINLNQNHWGQPLYPTRYPSRGYEEPDSQRAFDSTGEFWRTLAEGVNSTFGGDAIVSSGEVTDVHPATFKRLAEEVGGGLGKTVERTLALPGKIAKGEVGPNDIPLLRRVVGTPFGSSDTGGEEIGQFYERLKLAETVIGEAKERTTLYPEGSKHPAYQEWRKGHENLLDFRQEVKKANQILRRYSAADSAARDGRDRILTGKQRLAIAKETSLKLSEVPKTRPLTAEEYEKIRTEIREKKAGLAERFNEAYQREVIGGQRD